MDESAGHVMYECLELSELRNEVYGECEFYERWLVNIMRYEFLAGIKI